MQEAFRPNLAREKSKQELEQFSAEIGNILVPPDVNAFTPLRTPPNARIAAIGEKTDLRFQMCRAAFWNGASWRAESRAVYRIETPIAVLDFTEDAAEQSAHILTLSSDLQPILQSKTRNTQ